MTDPYLPDLQGSSYKLESQSSKTDERRVAGRHDGLENDKVERSVVSFCADADICSARRGRSCGGLEKPEQRKRVSPSLLGTADLECDRPILAVEAQDGAPLDSPTAAEK